MAYNLHIGKNSIGALQKCKSYWFLTICFRRASCNSLVLFNVINNFIVLVLVCFNSQTLDDKPVTQVVSSVATMQKYVCECAT